MAQGQLSRNMTALPRHTCGQNIAAKSVFFVTTRQFQSFAMAVSATATYYGRYSRRWCLRALTRYGYYWIRMLDR